MAASLPSYGGSGNPYGSVPAPISVQSPYQQTAGLVPGLPQLTGSASGVIGSELAGQLSPGTMSLLQTQSAEHGVGSGMPGSGLSQNDFLNSVGISSEQLTQQGVGNYLQLLTGLGSQQINPATQAQVGEYNSTMGAAPDPAAAAQLMDSMLNPTNQPLNNPVYAGTNDDGSPRYAPSKPGSVTGGQGLWNGTGLLTKK